MTTLVSVDEKWSESYARTFPLGGLVNHRVHVFMRGCLTLKLLGSSKTVLIWFSSELDVGAVPDSPAPLLVLPSEGEMGMVSSGTDCCCGLTAVATSAIVIERLGVSEEGVCRVWESLGFQAPQADLDRGDLVDVGARKRRW